MGHIDIENLFQIYYAINDIKKNHNLDVNFKVDKGSYETAIEFVGTNHFHPPISKDWNSNPTIFCPDLIDYNNRIIIEFEEEVGNPRAGAKLAKKGHHREGDLPTKRDDKRNRYYKQGGFKVLQIWKSDEHWISKLEAFLINNNFNNY